VDEGLIQILVIVGFVIFSMMEGAARKKRKQQQQAGTKTRPRPRHEYTEPSGTTDGDDHFETSEAPVPMELWDELVGIARGEAPVPGGRAGRSTTVGRESAPIPRVGDREGRPGREFDEPVPEYEEVTEDEGAYDRAVLEGTHPAAREERLPKPVAARHVAKVPVVRAARRPRAGSFRRLFRNRADVQRAVLIKEILGPPVGIRSPTD
jgi:hypothetical protein